MASGLSKSTRLWSEEVYDDKVGSFLDEEDYSSESISCFDINQL